MNKKIVSILSILLCAYLGMAWVYPYSFFSIQKDVSFHSDEMVVQTYNHELHEFRKIHEGNSRKDLVNERTDYIIQLYEQNWLTSEKNVTIYHYDLDTMLNQVKNTRYWLLELAFVDGYTQEAKEYLKLNIEQCMALEAKIMAMQNATFDSKTELNKQLKNLQNQFKFSLNVYTSFYKEYLAGNKLEIMLPSK